MNRIDPMASIRPSAEAKVYLTSLKDKGVFSRMVDGYLFAAAYGIKKDLEIKPLVASNRQDLIMVGMIDEDVRLSLEAGIQIISKHNGRFEGVDGNEALDLLCQYAEVGLQVLKKRWRGKNKEEIQKDICGLMS